MSSKIITLSAQLANQIAAGEVVERPVSVVKELLENALDAGANIISVRLKNAGIDLIEVEDNGEGISPEDLPKALEKYSTSKIHSLEDLYEVMTFGFRWEALASISSVSHFTLSSKQEWHIAGKSIFTEGGIHHIVSDVAHEIGTKIRVEHLFFNTPARLNYLKQARTEYLKIHDCIEKFALCFPEVSFTLEQDGKQTLFFPKDEGFLSRVFHIFWEKFSQHLLSIDHEFSWFHISWVISHPNTSFPQKSKQILYVNKRIVTSPLLSKAISDAYNRFIPHTMYPGYILFIEVDPTQIDVNVHPRKMEVRFASESTLFRTVYHVIENILNKVSLTQIPNDFSVGEKNLTSASSWWYLKPQERYYTGSGTKFKNYSPYTQTLPHPAQSTFLFSQSTLASSYETEEKDTWGTSDLHETPFWRIIGQVHNAYILVQTQYWVMLLDQHALAERVLYEKIATTSYTPQIQKILWGIGIHLDTKQYEVFQEHEMILEEMGFELEMLSHQTLMIFAIPDYLVHKDIEKIFLSILDDISFQGSQAKDEVRHKIWAYMACRAAVKFWDPLSIFEIHSLLRDASLDYSHTCPHGRPVVWEISLQELQKKYDR
jgi:DNA mismatch repair protein MutL